ncbi:MAG: hypothetical protein F6K08_30020 [Okeania sp. SIO1H6]|nr:hypothetical protein [Okeania sp. SIO1H6]
MNAGIFSVVSTTLSTELGIGDIHIRTVENLLAVLAGMDIDNRHRREN